VDNIIVKIQLKIREGHLRKNIFFKDDEKGKVISIVMKKGYLNKI